MNKKIILFSMCFMVLMLFSTVNAITTYTPTTKTTCLDGICNKIIQSGTTYVNENETWVGVMEAHSLKGTGFYVDYIEIDPDFTIDVIDYNMTSISMYLNFTGNYQDYPAYCSFNNITNETKCKFTLKDKWTVFNETTQEYDEFELEYEQEFEIEPEDNKSKEVIEFKYESNPFGRKFKFGGNSTTILLQDADTENLEDASAYACRINTFIQGYDYTWLNHQPGHPCFTTINVYRFNLTSVPQGYNISEAIFGLNIHDNNLQDDAWLNVSANELYPFPIYNITSSEYKWYTPTDVVSFSSEKLSFPSYIASNTVLDNDRIDFTWYESDADNTPLWNITFDIGTTQTVKRIRIFAGQGSYIDKMPCSVTDVLVCDDPVCSGESNLLVSTNNFSLVSGWHEVSFSDTDGRYIMVKGDSLNTVCNNATATNSMISFTKFEYSNATKTKEMYDWYEGDFIFENIWNIAYPPIFNWAYVPTIGQYNATPDNTTLITNDSSGVVHWDVTPMVSSAFESGYHNVTVMLNSTNGSTASYIHNVEFFTKEYITDPTLRPFLNITYILERPQYSTNTTNTTHANYTALFALKWTTDATALSGYIFSYDNGTGALINDSWTPFTGTINWSNVTKDLNETIGSTIRWQVYANDTDTLWTSSEIFTFNTSNTPPTPTPVTITPSPAETTDNLTCGYTYADADGDSESGVWYQWYINDVKNTTDSVLYTGNFTTDDNIICEVIVADGYENSTAANSTTLTIGDTVDPVPHTQSMSGISGLTGVSFTVGINVTEANSMSWVYMEITDPNLVSTNQSMSLDSGSSPELYYTKSYTPASAGLYTFKFYCLDGSGNLGYYVGTQEFTAILDTNGGAGGSSITIIQVGVCGDGVCTGDETIDTCPEDCTARFYMLPTPTEAKVVFNRKETGRIKIVNDDVKDKNITVTISPQDYLFINGDDRVYTNTYNIGRKVGLASGEAYVEWLVDLEGTNLSIGTYDYILTFDDGSIVISYVFTVEVIEKPEFEPEQMILFILGGLLIIVVAPPFIRKYKRGKKRR